MIPPTPQWLAVEPEERPPFHALARLIREVHAIEAWQDARLTGKDTDLQARLLAQAQRNVEAACLAVVVQRLPAQQVIAAVQGAQ